MPASRSASVEPSFTSIVLAALVAADDFVSATDLATLTGLTTGNCRTALTYLRDVHAVDSVDSAGRLYWFATPDADQRTRAIDARKREDEPRAAGKRPSRRNTQK